MPVASRGLTRSRPRAGADHGRGCLSGCHGAAGRPFPAGGPVRAPRALFHPAPCLVAAGFENAYGGGHIPTDLVRLIASELPEWTYVNGPPRRRPLPVGPLPDSTVSTPATRNDSRRRTAGRTADPSPSSRRIRTWTTNSPSLVTVGFWCFAYRGARCADESIREGARTNRRLTLWVMAIVLGLAGAGAVAAPASAKDLPHPWCSECSVVDADRSGN